MDSIGCQTRVSIARGGSKKLVIAITTNHRPPSKYTPKKRPDGSWSWDVSEQCASACSNQERNVQLGFLKLMANSWTSWILPAPLSSYCFCLRNGASLTKMHCTDLDFTQEQNHCSTHHPREVLQQSWLLQNKRKPGLQYLSPKETLAESTAVLN